VIGAAGSLFAWAATFVALPALLTTFDKRRTEGFGGAR
jgi:hypothetical protein